jgi:hypothetical protein
MNLLETLVYNLPEPIQTKALDVADKSDDCCTVNCKSIDVVSDYINELESLLLLCTKDLYSSSGKFKKSTALKLYNYVNTYGIQYD